MKENKILENRLTVPVFVFGVFLIIFGFIIKSGFSEFANQKNSISVTGSAERLAMSDTAKWNISVSTRVEGLNQKLGNAEIARNIKAVSEYLQKNGLEAKNISIASVQSAQICELNAQGYESCNLGVKGYTLSQNIIAESEDVNKIAELSKSLNSNFENINFTNNTVEYYYNKLKDIRVDMLSEATKNAKERADSVAKAGGAKVDKIVSLSSGVFQLTAKNSVEVSDYGTYDTSSIEKKITATVKVDFSLK